MSNIETPHTILSVTLLATGRLIMATEKRMYELINDVWTPMKFADDKPPQAAVVEPSHRTFVDPSAAPPSGTFGSPGGPPPRTFNDPPPPPYTPPPKV